MDLQILPSLVKYGEPKELQDVWKAAGEERWGSILKCAPLALSRIGLCYAAASHKEAALIQLPQGGELQYTHVRANLIHCADLGREAFREAEMQMRRVQVSARQVCEQRGILFKLVRALNSPNPAPNLINVYVEQLGRFAKNCEDGTDATKNKFDHWSSHTDAFYRACHESKDDNALKLDCTQREQEEQRTTERQTKDNIDEVEKETNRAAEEVEKARAAFEEAKSDCGESKYFAAFAEGCLTATFSTVCRVIAPQPVQPTPEAPNTQSTPNPGAADILLPVADLLALATAELPNMGEHDKIVEYCQKAAGCVEIMERKLEDPPIASSHGSNPAIEAVLGSYRAAVETAKQLLRLGDKDGPASKWDLSQAKTVQSRLKETCSDYWAKAEWFLKQYSPASPTTVSQAAEGVYARRLELAAARIKAANQDLDHAQTRLRNLREEERDLKRGLKKTEALMEELDRKCTTLEGIRGVLKECLSALSMLKSEIQNLQGFFDKLHFLIKERLLEKVGRFSDEAGAGAAALADPEFREDLRIDAKNLMVWFGVAFELATLYVDVSVKHIMPNIQALDELAALAGGDDRVPAKTLATKIQTHLMCTQVEIGDMADKKRGAMEEVLVLAPGRVLGPVPGQEPAPGPGPVPEPAPGPGLAPGPEPVRVPVMGPDGGISYRYAQPA